MRLVYTALFYALAPLLLFRLFWKGLKQPGYRQRIGERFGFYAGPSRDISIWIHAVSVGECEAAFPLIQALLADSESNALLVTCTTPTGSQRIRDVLGDRVQHVYLPYDLPFGINRFFDHFRPRLGLIMETEVWPNLFLAAQERQLSLGIINGRLSDQSVKGYARIQGLIRRSLAGVKLIAAQTPADAAAYARLGAPTDAIHTTGNIKFDVEFDRTMQQHAKSLRHTLFGERPVWIAGSTHPGEEEQLLEALDRIRAAVPHVLLVLAPRHPERTPAITELCRQAGYAVQTRSEGKPCRADTSVFLIDGVGELRLFYGTADVAYIGGSLVPHGGQNVLEAASAGLPVLFGPHVSNFRDICRNLLSQEAATQIQNAAGLAEWITRWLQMPELAAACGERGRAYVESNRGALRAVLVLIRSMPGYLPTGEQSILHSTHT